MYRADLSESRVRSERERKVETCRVFSSLEPPLSSLRASGTKRGTKSLEGFVNFVVVP